MPVPVRKRRPSSSLTYSVADTLLFFSLALLIQIAVLSRVKAKASRGE